MRSILWLLALLAVAANALIARPLLLGVEGVADPSPAQSKALADLTLQITQELQKLALATLAALSFLFSDKVSTYWTRSTALSRHLVLFGGLLSALSLVSGLLVSWSVLSLTADSAVRGGLPGLMALQVLQLAELAVAFLTFGSVAAIAALSTSKGDL